MKYIKLFENFEDYDPYELMIISPNKKAEMLVSELEKGTKANLNLVSDLITLGANLDWQSVSGKTPLLLCAGINHVEILRMLIDAGADLNMKNNSGWAALHNCAYRKNCLESAKMLIEAGADVNIQKEDGSTALHLSVINQYWKITELLINNGADLNIQDEEGNTPLHIASSNGLVDTTDLLLRNGADPSIQNNDGHTYKDVESRGYDYDLDL